MDACSCRDTDYCSVTASGDGTAQCVSLLVQRHVIAGKEVVGKLRTHRADGIHTDTSSASRQDPSHHSLRDSQTSSSHTSLSVSDEWPSESDASTSDESDDEDVPLTHLQRLQLSSREWNSVHSRQRDTSSSSSSREPESDWETYPIGQMQVALLTSGLACY